MEKQLSRKKEKREKWQDKKCARKKEASMKAIKRIEEKMETRESTKERSWNMKNCEKRKKTEL